MAEEHDLDDDLTDDLDEGGQGGDQGNEGNQAPQLGDQEDGSVIVPIEEEANDAKQEGTGGEKEETEADRERIREQRRQERIEKKQRAKEREDRIRRELESERTARRQLEERLSTIERRSTGAEIAQIDAALNQTRQAHAHFKEQIRIGQEQNDGAMIADATEKMLLAQNRFQQLTNVKQAYQQRQSAPAPLDPTLVRHANNFMSKHTWYRPDGNDDDSSITRTLDNKLAAEGWDPKTPEYWKELEERVKKYLPHRAGRAAPAADTTNGQPKPKSVVTGSGRDGAASSPQAGTFRLSPARVAAMKEAGVWEDPKKRADAIKRYREFDKSNKGN